MSFAQYVAGAIFLIFIFILYKRYSSASVPAATSITVCAATSIAGCTATCIDGKCLGCASDSYCAPEALPRVLREKDGGYYIIEPIDPSNMPPFENVPASTVNECISAAKAVGGVCALLSAGQKTCTVFKSTDGLVANYNPSPNSAYVSIVISKSPPLHR